MAIEMTHLLLWLLLYPLVAAADVVARVQVVDTDVGRLDQGHVVVYCTGTLILLLLHYV
mgnify:CR=1 FL=1|jgi:hypothetical protein